MKKVGITGQNGFVGYHLTQTLRLQKDAYEIIAFERSFFEQPERLDAFVIQCDVIVHLAALNRHNDPQMIFETNMALVRALVTSLDRTGSQAHIIVASSTQEERDNAYGKSKKEGRLLFSDWANRAGGRLSGMLIPNIYGPFGHPYFNSVVATFCHQIARNQTPTIELDAELKLIYVGELVEAIILAIQTNDNTQELCIPHTAEAKVTEILSILQHFKEVYQEKGAFPNINNDFEHKLFNTYRCYMDIGSYFPRPFVEQTDTRGAFVEIARYGIAGQTSFSTTVPGITRGNHFHTRKIERFAVIRGKALIHLRRIGTEEVINFYLDGDHPAYVDMPIWHTHNIKNIGNETLYTIFWINEPYDESDPDTWGEVV